MRKEDIVFTLPISRITAHGYSSGILYLSAYLREKGYDNIIIEPHKLKKKRQIFHGLNKELFNELESNLYELLAKLNPKYVGIPSYTTEFNEVAKLIKGIKKICNARIIVGGCHATAVPEDFLNYGADFVIFGEGETTLLEVIKSLEEGKKDFKNIDGLAWKKENRIIINKPRALIEDLDSLPLPAYDKIDVEHYIKIWDGTIRGFPLRAATIVTSRGCPFNCSFCGCNEVFGRKIRFRGKGSIKKEIKLLKEKYKVEGIMFSDDILTVNKKHLKMVCEIMKKYGMLWSCQARVNSIDDEIMGILKKSGCLQLDLGVESGSQRVLDDLMGKGITVEETKNAFRLCEKYGINKAANFIIGMPTETKEEMEETFDLAKEINANYYLFSIAAPFPGTRLYKMIGGNISPDEYYKLDWSLPYIAEFNHSKVKDLFALRNYYYKKLSYIMIRNAILNFPKYFRLWLILPRKIQRLNYIIKKAFNLFIVKPIFKRPLKL